MMIDLSNIPKPSEYDLQFATCDDPVEALVSEYECTLSVLREAQNSELTVLILAAEALLQKIRVIAAILRQGSVLANHVNLGNTFETDEILKAISFFEQFGGEE